MMSLLQIKDPSDFNRVLKEQGNSVVVGFFGSFSNASRATEDAFRAFASGSEDLTVLFVDVAEVKGIHKRYGVTTVPTVIQVKEGKVIQKIVGKQKEDYYENALMNHSHVSVSSGEEKKGFPPVTVWVGDSCIWCTRVKTYLRKNRVPFREVNISRDPSGASSLQAKTGQTGVPQLSIGGRYVVGFDKAKIDEYLGLKSKNGE
jgi:glutaredoxin